MQQDLLETMEEVRDYFRKYHDKFEPLSTEEVIKRILSGTSQALTVQNNNTFHDGNNVRVDLELGELDKARVFNNNNYEIHAHRPIHSHRKIIGKFIIFSKKIIRKLLAWYINPIIEDQNKMNASLTQCINEIENKFIVIENNFRLIKESTDIVTIRELQEALKTQSEKLERLDYKTDDLIRRTETVEDDLIRRTETVQDDLTKHSRYIEEIRDKLDKYHEMDSKLNSLREELQSDLSYLTYRIKNNDEKGNEEFGINKNKAVSSENNSTKDKNTPKIDYFLFENRFRGSERSIKEAQKIYLKHFEGRNNVIDLGCGRGEFLELLIENDIKAIGIEPYRDYAEYCKYKGLNVLNTDAVEYLSSLPDNSVDGIFMGQVLEHLSEEYLLKLMELAYKKLTKGSYFVAETPNPTMLSTFTNSFYLDLSHVKPVHPKTISFIAEYFGFKNTEIIFTDNSKIDYNLPLLIADEHVHNAAEFNDGINLLNQLLFGYQDYAIIARK